MVVVFSESESYWPSDIEDDSSVEVGVARQKDTGGTCLSDGARATEAKQIDGKEEGVCLVRQLLRCQSVGVSRCQK